MRGTASILKRKYCHFDEIVVIGCTGSCNFDNFWCSQWRQFRQNCDVFISVHHLITLYTDILPMTTIVFSPGPVVTVIQVGFMALTVHIIEPDRVAARSVLIVCHRQAFTISQHLADDIGGRFVKTVVTDGAPLPVVVNFNSSGVPVTTTIDKTDWKKEMCNRELAIKNLHKKQVNC